MGCCCWKLNLTTAESVKKVFEYKFLRCFVSNKIHVGRTISNLTSLNFHFPPKKTSLIERNESLVIFIIIIYFSLVFLLYVLLILYIAVRHSKHTFKCTDSQYRIRYQIRDKTACIYLHTNLRDSSSTLETDDLFRE